MTKRKTPSSAEKTPKDKSPPSAKKAKTSKGAKTSKSTVVDLSNDVEVGTEHDKLGVDAIYQMLVDPDDPEQIDGDGICKLCEMLGIDSQDVKALMLMWRLGVSKTPGAITKVEFETGMKTKIAKKTIKDLKTYLPFLDCGFLDNDEYREFYRWTHFFSRESASKRSLEKDVAVVLLGVVLDPQRAPHLASFREFLQDDASKEYTHLSQDVWDAFYVFNRDVDTRMNGYDEESSWPTLLDSYVAWARAKMKDAPAADVKDVPKAETKKGSRSKK